VHPAQEERIQVIRGSLNLQVGRRETVLEAGQRTTVAAGSPHTYWNAGDEQVFLVAEIKPALQLESFLEARSYLGASVNGARRGSIARLLQRAVVAEAHLDTVRAAHPHPFLQRLVLGMAAPIGHALGFEPYHSGSGERAVGTNGNRRKEHHDDT